MTHRGGRSGRAAGRAAAPAQGHRGERRARGRLPAAGPGRPCRPPSRPLGAACPPRQPTATAEEMEVAGTLLGAPRGAASREGGGCQGHLSPPPAPTLHRAGRGLSPSPAAILQISRPSPGNGSHRPPATWSSRGGSKWPSFEAAAGMKLPAVDPSEPSGSLLRGGRLPAGSAAGVLMAQRGGVAE